MAYERFQQGELTLRDELAIDRTRLANERTFLAYVRTAMMLLIAGGTAIKLFGDAPIAVVVGWALIGLGTGIGLFGGRRFLTVRSDIRRVTGASN
jgi:putative membrane protein